MNKYMDPAVETEPSLRCSLDGEWRLVIPSPKNEVDLPLRALLEHVRRSLPHIWKQVEEAEAIPKEIP